MPPLKPMLAKLARELPMGGCAYEPKWDGMRALVFRDGPEIDLRSRHDRPLARYFPELADALLALDEPRFVLDCEIVLPAGDGFDFSALLARMHPAASRVERLRRETPAVLIAFDLLAVGDGDRRDRPFAERRSALETLLARAPDPIRLARATDDPSVAAAWLQAAAPGIDGVVAKDLTQPYLAGRRAMTKVKLERTADCVVAGFRWLYDRPLLGSLLLGLYDADGVLEHIGVASSFTEARRRELLDEIAPFQTSLAGHPWERGFLLGGSPTGRLAGAAGRWSPEEMELDWVPLEPRLVCEVAYEHVDQDRFRHSARFRRWRPDRDPLSCRFDQLRIASEEPVESPVS